MEQRAGASSSSTSERLLCESSSCPQISEFLLSGLNGLKVDVAVLVQGLFLIHLDHMSWSLALVQIRFPVLC